MEFIVEDGRGSASFSVELGTDLSRHTLADLRSALGLRVAESHGSISPADIGLHRAMVFAREAEQAVPSSAHLQAGWRPDREGRISVIRPPHGAAPRPERPSPPEHPQPLDPLPAIPYATVIPMLMVSALMATLWSPTFALLGAASAAIPLFRALGPRLTRTRAERRHAEEWREYELACRANEAAWGHAVAEWLERLVFSPGEIDRLVESVTLRPWTRRLATGVCLPVAVGRGGLVIPDGPAIGLDDVPLVVDIERGLAVTGDRAEVLALARWIGIETAYRHGPADLECTIITTPDRRADWEWARWLPGFATVEVEHAGANAVAARMAEAAATQLVIADGPTPSGPGAFARLLSGQMAAARVLWLGAVHDVPAVCEQVLEVTADGYVRSLDGAVAGWTWRLAANEAETFARFLAPFADPEVEERSAPLPDAVPLARLCPLGTGSTGEEELRASWDRARPDQLRIPLGMSSDGPLVVDVVCDGPHALVAGTTGSGKSELLRSLVLAAALQQSPDDLAFVLVDFKGGGAFDVVAPLPHVAALVTDLEPAHATRALRSLRAELKYREVVLRQHGASDLSMLERGTSPPRLMIVVDEFAALAEELPEFLDGLVDVARRGRSLGVHLVLAHSARRASSRARSGPTRTCASASECARRPTASM
ncbi:MAG: FtsK/SpoIIIE domain-containing protein [Acidimicrobiales bacterium]